MYDDQYVFNRFISICMCISITDTELFNMFHNTGSSRCIPDTEDPCDPQFGLCEQQCSLYFGRVICTCYQVFVIQAMGKFHLIS